MNRAWILFSVLMLGCTPTQAPPIASPSTPPTPQVAALIPLPNAQGKLIATGEPTDLAIQGDAFFVLSRHVSPRTMESLVFTRDGTFHFEFTEGSRAGTGTHTLVNREGLFVLGFQVAVDLAVRPFGTSPEESIDSLSTRVAAGPGNPGLEVWPVAFQFDHAANNKVSLGAIEFSPQGLVSFAGEPPRDAQGQMVNHHIVLAAFSFPQYLNRLDRDTYTYQPAAGRVFMGTAGDGRPGKQIGPANVIVAGSVERR